MQALENNHRPFFSEVSQFSNYFVQSFVIVAYKKYLSQENYHLYKPTNSQVF